MEGLDRARFLMDSEMSEQDWREIIRSLANLVKNGERGTAQVAQILFSYRFGVPTQKVPKEDELRPIEIHTIEVEAIERPRKTKRRRNSQIALAPGTNEGVDVA